MKANGKKNPSFVSKGTSYLAPVIFIFDKFISLTQEDLYKSSLFSKLEKKQRAVLWVIGNFTMQY